MTIFNDIYSKFLRRRANVFLKNFPIFHLSSEEYLRDCRTLEHNFAGIVIGYPNPGVVIKIIPMHKREYLADVEPVSLGYFGEIVYRINREDWQLTGMCGFADQCGRIWCCGDVSAVIEYAGEVYFPYCIEPVFENLFFVRKVQLVRSITGEPALKVYIRKPFNLKIFRRYWRNVLLRFAKRFAKTKSINQIVFG